MLQEAPETSGSSFETPLPTERLLRMRAEERLLQRTRRDLLELPC
jgi:hypothetical protein